jgi:hypothetical protein
MNKPVAQLELVTAAKVDTKPTDSADGVITNAEPAKKTCALTVPVSAESADFDWYDDDVIAVREQRAIAVYFNPAGNIVIRQQTWPDEDPFVVISPDNLMLVIDRLCEIAGIPAAGGSDRP